MPGVGHASNPAGGMGAAPYTPHRRDGLFPTAINAPAALVRPSQRHADSRARHHHARRIAAGTINAPQTAARAPYAERSAAAPNVTAERAGAPGTITPETARHARPDSGTAGADGDARQPTGFAGVSDADMKADPGYQYRLQQAQSRHAGAAAKGVARGSNGWKALMQQA